MAKQPEIIYQDPDNPRDYEFSDGALSHAALVRRFRERTDGADALIEEPMDTGLWPTAGLSDDEIELLTDGLREVRRKELSDAGL